MLTLFEVLSFKGWLDVRDVLIKALGHVSPKTNPRCLSVKKKKFSFDPCFINFFFKANPIRFEKCAKTSLFIYFFFFIFLCMGSYFIFVLDVDGRDGKDRRVKFRQKER